MTQAMTPEMVIKRYFDTLAELLHGTVVTIQEGAPLTREQGIDWIHRAAREAELVET